MFLTESQKHYYTAMKKLGRKKPQKVIKRPRNQFLAMFYDLSNSRRFEIAIFILIFSNMLCMGLEHYNQPQEIFFLLEVCNAFFTTVFGLEAIVKIIGLRYHYFTVPWNMFDFLLVLASIVGILMEDITLDFPVSPTLLRVVRVFRIGRMLRLIKAAKGIRKLLFALIVSLPALFNIGALLTLITFIYAIIGMFLFGHVKLQGALDDMVNFQTFGRSMLLLFRLTTSAGWNDVLESLMVQPPKCDKKYRNQSNGDCGYPLLSIIYFTSFIIINYMIVINMYIAIILENFNQAHQEEEIGIVEDDLEMFYIRWSKYDPHASQFIRFTQLSDFIASLDPPLGITKPNTVALVSFNLPIARGNKIHCLDILHALVKHVLGHVDETETFVQLQEQMDIKFKKQFPTRKELEIVSSTRIWKRQDKAARYIQREFRKYLRSKKEAKLDPLDVDDEEETQLSSPGDWKGRLSAFLHVHRGSRASSRKSSRTSDTSELSDLGGPWLNIPLLLLTGSGCVSNNKFEGLECEEDLHMDSVGATDTAINIINGDNPLTSKNASITTTTATTGFPSSMLPIINNIHHNHYHDVYYPVRRSSLYTVPSCKTEQDVNLNSRIFYNNVALTKSAQKSPSHNQSLGGEIISTINNNLKHGEFKGALCISSDADRNIENGGSSSFMMRHCSPKKDTKEIIQVVGHGSYNNITDVAILVTDASPDTHAPHRLTSDPIFETAGATKVVEVLVHRESTDYCTVLTAHKSADSSAGSNSSMKLIKWRSSNSAPNLNTLSTSKNNFHHPTS